MGSSSSHALNPVSQVSGRPDVPIWDRPPTVAAFLDTDRGVVLVVTAESVESFNAETSSRRSVHQVERGQPWIVAADFNASTLLGPCVFVAFSDGAVKIFESPSLKIVKSLDASGFPATSLGHGMRQTTALAFGSKTSISAVRCPLNNALVCGYTDGTLRSFFLETGQTAGTYKPPAYTAAALVGCESQPSSSSSSSVVSSGSIHSAACSCIGFSKRKNWIAAAYNNTLKLSTSADGQAAVTGAKPRVVIYGLEGGKAMKQFVGCEDAPAVCLVFSEDAKRLTAVSGGFIEVWGVSEETRLCVVGLSSIIEGSIEEYRGEAEGLGRCVGAAMDLKESVVFAAFEGGSFAALKITAQHDEKIKVGEPNGTSTVSPLDVVPQKLFQLLDDPGTTDKAPAELVAACVCLTSVWYEARTNTVVAGCTFSRVRLAHDFFGRLAAQRLKQQQKEEEKRRNEASNRSTLPILSLHQTAVPNPQPGGNFLGKGLPILLFDPLRDFRQTATSSGVSQPIQRRRIRRPLPGQKGSVVILPDSDEDNDDEEKNEGGKEEENGGGNAQTLEHFRTETNREGE